MVQCSAQMVDTYSCCANSFENDLENSIDTLQNIYALKIDWKCLPDALDPTAIS